MKTTLEIPDKLLDRLKLLTRTRTEQEAILAALTQLDERSSLELAVSRLGTFEAFLTPAELRDLREQG